MHFFSRYNRFILVLLLFLYGINAKKSPPVAQSKRIKRADTQKEKRWRATFVDQRRGDTDVPVEVYSPLAVEDSYQFLAEYLVRSGNERFNMYSEHDPEKARRALTQLATSQRTIKGADAASHSLDTALSDKKTSLQARFTSFMRSDAARDAPVAIGKKEGKHSVGKRKKRKWDDPNHFEDEADREEEEEGEEGEEGDGEEEEGKNEVEGEGALRSAGPVKAPSSKALKEASKILEYTSAVERGMQAAELLQVLASSSLRFFLTFSFFLLFPFNFEVIKTILSTPFHSTPLNSTQFNSIQFNCEYARRHVSALIPSPEEGC